MKKFLLQSAALGASAFLLTACLPQYGQPSITPESAPPAQETESSAAMMEESAMMIRDDGKILTLTEQNGSGQTGTVTLREVDGQIEVTVDATDLGDTPQPAHIHVGMCPEPGAVQYPLNNVVNGQSVTMLALDAEALLAQEPLAVNLHKSAAEASVYTACANL